MIIPVFIPIDKETMESMAIDISDIPIWRVFYHGTQLLIPLIFMLFTVIFHKTIPGWIEANLGIKSYELMFMWLMYFAFGSFSDMLLAFISRVPRWIPPVAGQIVGVGAAVGSYYIVYYVM